MAVIRKVVRVANPRARSKFRPRGAGGRFLSRARAAAIAKRKRTRNPPKRSRAVAGKRRRKPAAKSASAPRIRKYSVKALKHELSRRGVRGRRKRGSRASSPAHRRRRNPVPVLIELGAINPRKTRRPSTVAKRRRKATARRKSNPIRRRRRTVAAAPVHHRRRSRRRRVANPVARTHTRRRRSVRRYRRRNPSAFGTAGGKNLITMTGGALIGMAAAKFLPTLLPPSVTATVGSGAAVTIGLTIASAFAGQMISRKMGASPAMSDAILIGGLVQAGAQILNVVAPGVFNKYTGISGLGDIIPGNFVVPQNPITSQQQVLVMPSKGVAGFGRAFRR